MDVLSLFVGASVGFAPALVKWIETRGANRRASIESAPLTVVAKLNAETARSTADSTGQLATMAMQGTQIGDLYRIINQRDEAAREAAKEAREAAKECEKRLLESEERCAVKVQAMTDAVAALQRELDRHHPSDRPPAPDATGDE